MDNYKKTLDEKNSLIGILNNNIISKEINKSTSFIVEDILLENKWTKDTEQNNYIYKYNNTKLNDNYFIQIIPNILENESSEIIKAEILQNIYIDSDKSTKIYNIYSKNKPTIDIKISIFATTIERSEQDGNKILGIFKIPSELYCSELTTITNSIPKSSIYDETEQLIVFKNKNNEELFNVNVNNIGKEYAEKAKEYSENAANEANKLFNRVINQSDYDNPQTQLESGIYFIKLGV